MISILIPIYNQKITKLTQKLKSQCEKGKIEFEIIAMDDGSKQAIKKVNEEIRGVFGINYIELSENIGRAKIRNWLAKLARYENLLFLDCDVSISDGFIKNFRSVINNYQVVYGGRIYTPSPPRSKNKYLHWLYGSKIESKSADTRKLNPYLHFQSNNVLVKSSIMSKTKFPENLIGYGYEDLALAHLYQQKGITITHIDNPVTHKGLDTTEDFLKKTKTSIHNLVRLENNGQIMDTKLIKFYQKLKKYQAIPLVRWHLSRKIDSYYANLRSESPNLQNLQKLKLHYYLSEKTR